MKSFVYGLILNIQFFTIFPLSKEVPIINKNIERAVQTFPLLGLMQGVIYSSSLYLLVEMTNLSPLASSFFIWLLFIILTGALHLDGWMDSSDAYFSYRDVEKRLTIMQDSRVGAFGVISIIVLLATRFIFVYETVLMINPETYWFILLIPFLGKLVMGMILYHTPLAKNEGMAHFFKKAIQNQKPWIYLFYITILGTGLFMIDPSIFFSLLVLLFFSLIIFIIIRKKVVSWFGGTTGDVLGASVEGVETFLWLIVWLLHYFAMV